MKPRMLRMALSIHFYDVLSSFFLQVGKVLHLLRCPCRSVWFSSQASRKRLQFNSLYSKKLQSPLTKDTDEGKDFIETFVFFSDLLLASRAKLGHVRAYITRGSRSPLHAKNLNFPESLKPGKKHEVACVPWAGGLLRLQSHLSMETVSHIIFLSVIFLFIRLFFYLSGLEHNGIFPWQS